MVSGTKLGTHSSLWRNAAKPVAFVFSGGVSLGAIQVGMLRAVMETGLRPQWMVGASAGSLNAAYIAQRFTLERLEKLERVWKNLTREDVFGPLTLRRFWRIFSGSAALANPASLERLIASHTPSHYTKLEIHLAVVTTDYWTGQDMTFTRGTLRRHLLASSSIPTVFPPVFIENQPYIDGSVSAHVPLLPAQKLGAQTLVVFDVGFTCEMKTPPKGLIDNALHIFSLMLHRQNTGLLSNLPLGLTVIYLPAPCPIDVAPYDFSQALKLMQAGYEVTSAFLRKLSLQGPGVYGSSHSHGVV